MDIGEKNRKGSLVAWHTKGFWRKHDNSE
ncbi:hypothetical protein C3L33_21881, partial [Rhododendron williamsianum]